MSNTINLQTVVTAPEPDRSKKYVSHGADWDREKPRKNDPLYYAEGRGWTWDSSLMYYSWDEYVQRHQGHFPLAEREREVTLTSGEFTHKDWAGDQGQVSVIDGKLRLITKGAAGEGFRSVHFERADIPALMDFLHEHVKISD